MCMKQLAWADAILTGPDVDPTEVFDLIWPYVLDNSRSFVNLKTKSGNWVCVPYTHYIGGTVKRMRIATINLFIDEELIHWQWPILPLKKHRGGYMTATAMAEVERAHMPYVTTDGKPIDRPCPLVCRRKGVWVNREQVATRTWTERIPGDYIKTKGKVLWVDRTKHHIVVDPLYKPRKPTTIQELSGNP